jgi:hypothetical protein
MELQINCSWKEKTRSGTLFISYEQQPPSLFKLKKGQFEEIKALENQTVQIGQSLLPQWEKLYPSIQKSPYALFCYFKILRTFELYEKATDLFQIMKKKFPKEVFVKCIEGHYLLDEEKTEEFSHLFNKEDVLLGAFPKKSLFYYEEALFFHDAYHRYYEMQNDQAKIATHEKFIGVIMHGLQSFLLSQKG